MRCCGLVLVMTCQEAILVERCRWRSAAGAIVGSERAIELLAVLIADAAHNKCNDAYECRDCNANCLRRLSACHPRIRAISTNRNDPDDFGVHFIKDIVV